MFLRGSRNRTGNERLLFGSDGCALSGDGLETGLDGLDRTPGVAGHALEEEQTGLLVQNGVRRSGSNWMYSLMCCKILVRLCKEEKISFELFN